MHKVGRALCLFLYYTFAAFLPDLAFPGGRQFNKIRCALLQRILPSFGDLNEIDSHIYVGDGTDVTIGNHCQINTGVRLTRVQIGDSVMLAPDVYVVGQMHETASMSVP